MRAEFLIFLSAFKKECVDQELTKSVTCVFLSGVLDAWGEEDGGRQNRVCLSFISSSTLF